MVQRLIPSSVLAAIAGAAMAVAVSSSPSLAFTLSSPSLAEPVIKADVQQVYPRGQLGAPPLARAGVKKQSNPPWRRGAPTLERVRGTML